MNHAPENQPLKFVIVGAGHIGKRHIDLLSRMDNCRVVAVIDNDPSKKEQLDPAVSFHETVEDYIANGPQADIANICTPNGLHAPHALSLLDNDQHVLIEKPMALTRTDCDLVLEKGKERGKKVFCVLQNRYTPTAKWVKSVIDDGLLGQIYMVQVNCFWNRDHRYYKQGGWRGTKALDGGTLFTQFSHFVDLVYWLFGEWKEISPVFNNYNHQDSIEFEDTGVIRFKNEQGATGVFSFTTAAWDQNMESALTIVGEKGSLKVGGQYMDRIDYCHIRDYEQPRLQPSNPPNNYGSFQGSASNHWQVFNNVVKALGNEQYEITEGKDAASVVALIEQIYRAGGYIPIPAIQTKSNGMPKKLVRQ